MRAAWRFALDVGLAWSADRVSRMSAALAYFSIFALAPLLIVGVAAAGTILGRAEARQQFLAEIQSNVGPGGARLAEQVLDNAQGARRGATLLGLAAMLFGASFVFLELQDEMNHIWRVQPLPGPVVRLWLRARLRAFGAMLVAGLLALAAMILQTALAAVSRFALGTEADASWPWARPVLAMAIHSFSFSLVYMAMPDARVSWRDVWAGALAAGALFTLGGRLIADYILTRGLASVYGAAGTLALVLLWVYYCAQILLLGAEISKAHARRRRSGELPPPRTWAERAAA